MAPGNEPFTPHRRRFMAGLIGSGAGVVLGGSAVAEHQGDGTPRPMMLVHGAWYGGWCWERVVPLLGRRGFAVTAPTLPGIAHRSAEAAAATLDTHVEDLCALLRSLDLRDVVLVGHSYGGMVISVLAERERARIRKLVYLDAFVPDPQMRVVDYLLPLERRAAIVKIGGDTGFVPPVPAQAFGISLAWVEALVSPQPFGTFSGRAMLSMPAAHGMPRAYIACVEPASGSFGQFAARIEKDSSWQYRALRAGHCAMITAPALLADTLVELAA